MVLTFAAIVNAWGGIRASLASDLTALTVQLASGNPEEPFHECLSFIRWPTFSA